MNNALVPLTYGQVVGRFVATVVDGTVSPDDPDQYPDAVPVQGSVIFKPSPPAIKVATAQPVPTTVLPAPITAKLDSQGYLSVDGVQGIWLLATDDPATNPSGWTYNVSFFGLTINGQGVQYAPFDIAVPAGSTVDLTTVAPAPTAPGDYVLSWQSAVSTVQASADAAASSAAAAEAAAASVNPGQPNGVATLDSSGLLPESQVPARLTDAELKAAYGVTPGVSNVLMKLTTGQNVTVAFIGDSGLEGKTVETLGDDCASRVTAALSSTFGVTVTKSNRAVSGYTAYYAQDPGLASPTMFSLALADEADLYVIGFGHNDIRSGDGTGTYGPNTGYPYAASIAAVEHMIRRIRTDVPGADIILTTEWPYTGTSYSSNTLLTVYLAMVRRLAAAYGCALADFWDALETIGVTGQNPTVDDVYIGNATSPYPQHPNDAGHGVWADTILALLPSNVTPTPQRASTPEQPLFGAERWTSIEYQAITVSGRAAGTNGTTFGGALSGQTVFPQTSTTAGDYLEANFIGSEVVFRIDVGAGQGVVSIDIDSVAFNASLNLANLSGGQARIPITGLTPGIHRVRFTVVSGTVTFRGMEYLPADGQHIKHDSGLITYTGAWSTGATAAIYYDGTQHTSTTNGDSFTLDFVGTGLGAQLLRYAAAVSMVVTVDGVASTQDWNLGTGGIANLAAWKTIVSGLPYGRHTVTVKLNSSGRALYVSSLFAFDETRTLRPGTLAGLGVVGTPVAYPVALQSPASISVQADDATSTSPPYVSANSGTGFTISGTPAARVAWLRDAARNAY